MNRTIVFLTAACIGGGSAVFAGEPQIAGTLNFEIVRDAVEDVVLVTDAQIVDAMRDILAYTKLLVEPSGAAAVAALLQKAISIKPTDRVVAVLSGGNVGLGDEFSPGSRSTIWEEGLGCWMLSAGC